MGNKKNLPNYHSTFKQGFEAGEKETCKRFKEFLEEVIKEARNKINKDKLGAIAFNIWIIGKIQNKIEELEEVEK